MAGSYLPIAECDLHTGVGDNALEADSEQGNWDWAPIKEEACRTRRDITRTPHPTHSIHPSYVVEADHGHRRVDLKPLDVVTANRLDEELLFGHHLGRGAMVLGEESVDRIRRLLQVEEEAGPEAAVREVAAPAVAHGDERLYDVDPLADLDCRCLHGLRVFGVFGKLFVTRCMTRCMTSVVTCTENGFV